MKKAQKQQSSQKNSMTPQLKITSETQCVMTVQEQGRFCEHGHNSTHNPRGFYEDPSYYKCSRRVTFNADSINYFISDEGNCLRGKGQSTWKKMTKIKRLEANLALNAEGKPFTYEILN